MWRSRSVTGWLIRLFSRADVNHAGLVIRVDHAHFQGRRFTLEALETGIVLRLLSERLRRYRGSVWLYPLKAEFNAAREAIGDWAIEREGTPYDYGSLLRQAFGRVSADMRYFFCSEYCYFAYRESGIPVAEPKAPRPGDIPRLGIFEPPILIYEG